MSQNIVRTFAYVKDVLSCPFHPVKEFDSHGVNLSEGSIPASASLLSVRCSGGTPRSGLQNQGRGRLSEPSLTVWPARLEDGLRPDQFMRP